MGRPTVKTLCTLALVCAAIPTVCQNGVHVPPMHGTALSGDQITFPDALTGKVNVVVVGFSHSSQGQLSNWGRLIQADYGRSTDVNYFELAMLAGAPHMLRGMIIKRMGSSVPFDERPHYIPVLEGEPAWRATAHYDRPDDAYVLLVDRTGLVLWQTEGEATNQAYASLKEHVKDILNQRTATGRNERY